MRWNLASRHPPLEKSAGFKEWHQPQLRLKRELFAKSQKIWRSGKTLQRIPKNTSHPKNFWQEVLGFGQWGLKLWKKCQQFWQEVPKLWVLSLNISHYAVRLLQIPERQHSVSPPPQGSPGISFDFTWIFEICAMTRQHQFWRIWTSIISLSCFSLSR